MLTKDQVGREGEQRAQRWLRQVGMVILDTNWRCRVGELDIVARDGSELVFVEVKTRTSTAYGHPAEAVTPAKLARIRGLAALWLREHDEHAEQVRIDVVAILLVGGTRVRLEHLRGVG
ncbi:MAG: YraN family protein [Beutenbergiaceae bacterium]